jgi:hypothetical protein
VKIIFGIAGLGICLLVATETGIAKDKKQPELPHVYDHTATIEWRANDWDAEYHVATEEGPASMYCSQYGNDTECSTRRGDGWWIIFDDGTVGPCCDISWSESTWKYETQPITDPLSVLTNSLIGDNRLAHHGTFKYRIGRLYRDNSGTFCVPDNKTDKKGRTIVGEACYGTIFIQQHQQQRIEK